MTTSVRSKAQNMDYQIDKERKKGRKRRREKKIRIKNIKNDKGNSSFYKIS